jgi:hypothetical protein
MSQRPAVRRAARLWRRAKRHPGAAASVGIAAIVGLGLMVVVVATW